jgi:hypothetical protein
VAEWLIWIAVVATIVLLIRLTIRSNERRKHRTAAQYEREVARSKGFVRTIVVAAAIGLSGLQGLLQGQKKAAVERLKDEEEGMTKTGDRGDDKDRTAVE